MGSRAEGARRSPSAALPGGARTVRNVPRLAPRPRDSHKGDFGRVLVVAGSRGMAGAAALAGDAALRAGAGLVTVASPAGVYPILAAKLTCCTTHPLPETPAGTLGAAALREILVLADGFDVVALGPGLGRDRETDSVVRGLVRRSAKPMVIDADGLNALAESVNALKRAGGPRILTPHPGEMGRLLGEAPRDWLRAAREGTAIRFAREHGVVLVLKGHGTLVTDGERIYRNRTGNPGMATGGTGDVLTGVIAGLLGQGLRPFDAAVLGVWAHGRAGDIAARAKGEVSLVASDLLDALPEAFRMRGRARS